MSIENILQGVAVECIDERGILGEPARITIRNTAGKLMVEIHAIIEPEQGADGGWYRAVRFKQIKPDVTTT